VQQEVRWQQNVCRWSVHQVKVNAFRRVLISLALTLSLLGCAGGKQGKPSQSPAGSSSQTSAVEGQQSPGLFLYEVELDDRRSHVMGTMHVGFGFEEALTPEARTRFESAQRVMMEADVTAANPSQMMQAAMLPPDRSLRAMLGDKVWHALVARVGQTVPPPVLDKLKPWMPAVLLAIEDLQRAMQEVRPDGAQHMMDVELMQAAKQAQKKLMFLETIDEQLAIFGAIPEKEQIAELGRALSDHTALGRSMVEAFAQGDEPALTAALFDKGQMQAAPGFYEAMLYQRNARWIPVIEAEMQKGNLFVAVGAGHLFGKRGILAELKQRGYRVRRIGG